MAKIQLNGKKITINLFFLGIFFGGVAYLLSGSKGSLIGSSAGISSLLFFLLLLSPNLGVRIFRFTIEFKYIMAFILFTDFKYKHHSHKRYLICCLSNLSLPKI